MLNIVILGQMKEIELMNNLSNNVVDIFRVFKMRKNNKKGPRYLDVADFMLTGPFSPQWSPGKPVEQEQPQFFMQTNSDLYSIQSNTPLSRPLYIEIEGGEPSPYLKELINKVGPSQIQFLDFTLEGNVSVESMQYENDMEEEMEQAEHPEEDLEDKQQMSVIEEEEQEQANSPEQSSQKLQASQLQEALEDYVPNMHLLDLDPSFFTRRHFNATLESLKDEDQEKKKEFLLLYLTDDNLEQHKDSSIATLVKVARFNLQKIGIITRLERKAKVSRYIQKKKKRIWRKKINYDCRKQVADNRLRVKGKFVTKEQACQMLGIELCSQEELKAILKRDNLI